MPDQVRVRFAPSPTGPLHIGGVRTALYNYLFAKQKGGSFLLRIEDTDQARYVPGAESYIIESLRWCGIHPDEGIGVGGPFTPYRQSERKDLYKPFADQLVKEGKAYYAFDTAEELDQLRDQGSKTGTFQYGSKTRMQLRNSLVIPPDEAEGLIQAGVPYVIRILIQPGQEIRLHDLIRGEVVVQTDTLDDKVLFKSDGMPTYHLANVVDDHLMEITHVIRGEEWLPSAPLHVLLYDYLGWKNTQPHFAHLPLLLKPDGNGKLSKRDGDRLGFPVFPLRWTDPVSGEVSSGYREAGYLPEAVLNFLAFLGWNPGTEQEIFSMKELVQAFSLERVQKAGAKFDFEKARWFNQHYLKTTPDETLALFLQEQLLARSLSFPQEYVTKVCSLVKERITFTSELWEVSSYFFTEPESMDPDILAKKWKPETQGILDAFRMEIENADFTDPASLEDYFKKFLETRQLNAGAVLSPLRMVLTGKQGGPGVFDIMALLGKTITLQRLSKPMIKP